LTSAGVVEGSTALHTRLHTPRHGTPVVGGDIGSWVLPVGAEVVAGAPVVVEVVDVSPQPPVGHCHIPLLSAVHTHLPAHSGGDRGRWVVVLVTGVNTNP
jgi:hypothetical protein